MRKWVFIFLPIICCVAFLVINYLISSSELFYLSQDSHTKIHDLDDKEKFNNFGNKPSIINNTNHPPSNNITTQGKKFLENPINKNTLNSIGEYNNSNTFSYNSPASSSGVSPVALTLASQQEPSSSTEFIMGNRPFVFFSLEFINEQVLEHNQLFNNIPVGGLSAISYHSETDTFLALSDDKGQKGYPPRFYQLQLHKDKEKKYKFVLKNQVFIKDNLDEPFHPIDPEGMAIFQQKVFISSEGAQMPHLVAPPGVFVFDLKGKWQSTWDTPKVYWPEDITLLGKWGVKENKAFEALSVDANKQQLWLATESSLHQDRGLTEDSASNTMANDSQQYIRIGQFDIGSKNMIHQFIYPADYKIDKNNLQGNNGLTDFLALGDNKLLTLERTYLKDSSISGDRKTDANWVRLFLTDCSGASDVSQHEALNTGKFITCGKVLLLDLSSVLGKNVDNIEGIAIGPEISKDSHLLVLVSDNNFSPSQKTQFLFFHLSLL